MDGPRGRLVDGDVRVGGDARQRYYDSRGYGRPLEGNELLLSSVEAAHLLYRGDLAAIEVDGAQRGFAAFVTGIEDPSFAVRFLVYADLRERGFYLSPAREGWVDEPPANADFAVYERGSGPWSDEPYSAVRVVGERTAVPAPELEAGVLAVVDEESEVTYFEVEHPGIGGDSATFGTGTVEGELLADRVIVWDAPDRLFGECFYGQPLAGRQSDRGVLQLSLVEAAYLVRHGILEIDGPVLERGRTVEGDRFDRRLAVYADLRERGTVPKTGFKFGADFRVYADVESVDELGHSERLVRVLPSDHVFSPRDLALDVRLAHGVRKRMTFALADDAIEWFSVGRITP
jgi:tRNA-intron endonuclease, archaea type